MHKADPVGMGRKSCLHTLLKYSVLARLPPHPDWISWTYVFGAISSSSILRAYLFTTYSSMTFPLAASAFLLACYVVRFKENLKYIHGDNNCFLKLFCQEGRITVSEAFR